MNTLLTTILGTFQTTFVAGAAITAASGLSLLYIIMVIDVLMSHLFNLEEDHFKILCKNLIKYGFWMWLLQNYVAGMNLKGIILNGFIQVATNAAGGGVDPQTVFNPSYIIDIGYSLMDKVYGFVQTTQASGGIIANTFNLILSAAKGDLSVANLFPNFFYWAVSLFIGLAFLIMAWQIFITLLEFHLIAALVPIFLPFGALQRTAFLAESAIGAIISSGIKMMVLVFIMATAIPIISSWTTMVGAQPTQRECMQLLGGCMAVALLSWVAPGIAAGLMSGRPKLTAATAAGAAMALSHLVNKAVIPVSNPAPSSVESGIASKSRSIATGLAGGSGYYSDVRAATLVAKTAQAHNELPE